LATSPVVEPAVATSAPKADAICYARRWFGGAAGEIHVYDNTRETSSRRSRRTTESSNTRTPNERDLRHLFNAFEIPRVDHNGNAGKEVSRRGRSSSALTVQFKMAFLENIFLGTWPQ
jgi:hypothetical protein